MAPGKHSFERRRDQGIVGLADGGVPGSQARLPVENFNNLALFILRRHRQLDIQELLWTDSFATNFGSGIRCDPNQKYRQGK